MLLRAVLFATVMLLAVDYRPAARAAQDIDFERHVVPLLGKLGCNAGSCHGSFQGKGGLRLSLFGHDPDRDFQALTRDAQGRRINVAEPDRSLILLKPSGQLSHGGRKRFDKDSWQYRVLRSWVAGGGRRAPGSGQVRTLRVTLDEQTFRGPGESVPLAVQAEFTDGTRADVTPFCEFRAKDDSIAEVSPLGEVSGVRPGDTAIIVSYGGNLAVARIYVPFPAASGLVHPHAPEWTFIDREVFAKLRRLNIVPSELSSDAEFLRRITIDTIGGLPSPQEVRDFLADSRPDKRNRKIEELLAHPLHAALWATKFCDITACNVDVMDSPGELRPKRAKMWHDWFRRRVAENRPYDEIVRGVLTATSREGREIEDWISREISLDQATRSGFETAYAERPTLDLFWRRIMGEEFFPLEQMAELNAAAFLGVRIECAQCHKHPFDRWTQADYRGFANIFSDVQFGSSPEVTAATVELLARRRELPPERAGPPIPRLREVYVDSHRARRLLDDSRGAVPAKALGGPAIGEQGDRREELFRWLRQPNNPFFARSFVNRVWAHYFGVGLVEPVDSFSLANPASNERLLDALARDFVDHGYDLRRLERIILSSRTYQLSSVPNSTNARDRTNYSRAMTRPLMAEVVVDVLNSALGTSEDMGGDAPSGSRAIEVATNRARSPHLARVFRVFGRPARATTCDCERAQEPTVPQTLFLMTDPGLLKKITEGRLKNLLAEARPDDQIVEELFLATLSRPPDEGEKHFALAHVQAAKDRQAGFVDLVWALINTREFILNH